MPLHPMIVHLPIALSVLLPLLSAGLLLAWWRGLLPRRAYLVAALLQALLVGSTVAALRTGEAEEERVERVVRESRIEAHEEAAETFLWGSIAVLALMAGAAALRRETLARSVAAVATAGTLAVLGLGYRVGDAGGRLVYEDGAASAYTGQGPGQRAAAHEDDD